MKKILFALLAALLITWGIWMALHMGFWSLFVVILAVFFIFPAIRRSEERAKRAKEESEELDDDDDYLVIQRDPKTKQVTGLYNRKTGELKPVDISISPKDSGTLRPGNPNPIVEDNDR